MKEEEGEQRKKQQLQECRDSAELQVKQEDEEEEEQFSLAGGGGGASHLQLSLSLDGSHLSPSMLSDSALTCLPGLLPQDGSVLCVSTAFIPPPPPPPPVLLQPKEEAEPVEVPGGGAPEARACVEDGSERGSFYDVEVELPGCGSDEETVTASSPTSDITNDVTPCDITVPANDVTACDITSQPDLSLSSGPVDLLGGGVSDAGGRGLLRLLRALRTTVLPAHWVAVLADGPVLQLLQCSRLSSMMDTIVHVGPDRHVYVSVQNRPLPDSHRLYQEHEPRVEHLSQLVSLLLDLERMTVCPGRRVRPHPHPQRARSPACHLLLAPPCITCLPCLLEEEEEDDDDEDDDDDDDNDDDDDGGVETEN